MQSTGLLPLRKGPEAQLNPRAYSELGDSLTVTEEAAGILSRSYHGGSDAQD